jgi:adenosylcobinamide-GDP ribazoletransferase
MTGVLRPAAAAVSFLTRAPIGRLVRVDAADVTRGAWLFPAVGGAVGGASGLLADLTAEWLPSLASGGLAVAAAALMTGALHLDALADTADSLGASSRERALEIMRDHAVGTFGAVALIVVCVIDAAIIGALAQTGDAAPVGLAAGAAGRAAMLPQALALPYARAGGGQGLLLTGIGSGTVVLGLAITVLLALPAGLAGVCALGAAALASLVLGLGAWHRFGGVTGDVLGATAKLAETAALIAAVVVVTDT